MQCEITAPPPFTEFIIGILPKSVNTSAILSFSIVNFVGCKSSLSEISSQASSSVFFFSSILDSSNSNNLIGKPTFFANPNVPNGFYAFTYINLWGNVTVGRSSVNAFGAAGPVTGFSLPGFASGTVMPTAVPAHGGFFLVGQSSTTATDTLVRKMDNATSFAAEYTNTISGTTFTVGAYQAANVVAPEPGSMIALGVGIAALLRKRRSTV